MNLTNQQLLQVFHIYSNAKVLCDKEVFDIEEIHSSGHVFITNDEKEHLTKTTNSCQLILRSIDQITEEEKRELAEFLEMEGNTLGVKDGKLCMIFRGHLFNGYIETKNIPYPAADYLRSKNIALPYMGVDLIEAGIAVCEK